MGELAELREAVRQFAIDAGFDAANTPKNLAVSVSIEAAELLECFQWSDTATSKENVRDELADVLIYLIRLSDRLGIDLGEAVQWKLRKNRRRYRAASRR